VGRGRPVYFVRRIVSKLVVFEVRLGVVPVTVPSKKAIPLVGRVVWFCDKLPSESKIMAGKLVEMLAVKIRTEILVPEGRAEMEFGKKAIPWGRTIQDPVIVAGLLVLVGFQATTAIERYLYASTESLSGKTTAALVPVLMAVFLAISRAPMTWLRACLRPPLPVRPFRAGTATAASSPMMPMTARSSTRVKAVACQRGGGIILTKKINTPVIYIVNTSLKCKYCNSNYIITNQ